VLAGLWLVHLTGWYWLDGAVACLLGLNILVTGAKLVLQAFSGLMDAVRSRFGPVRSWFGEGSVSFGCASPRFALRGR
jgi:hypothetical protein